MEHPGPDNSVDKFTPSIEVETALENLTPNPRQQDKIIKYIITGNVDVVGERQVLVYPTEHRAAMIDLKNDQVPVAAIHKLLMNIQAPIDREPDKYHPTTLFNRIALSPQELGIVADLGRGNFNERDELTPVDLARFLDRYPDPITLDHKIGEFLDRIEKQNSPTKRVEYEKSFNSLKQTIYGKRHEYWEQYKLLQTEAQTTPRCMDLYPGEADSLLQRTEIHNSKYEGVELTPEMLGKFGLEPKHYVQLNNINLNFSDVYAIDEDRLGVVGYTETADGRVVARSYYMSKSQGLWRYLPSYDNKDGKYKGWYDKGYDEDSLNLPITAQSALSELALQPSKQIDNPKLVFYGTAKDLYQDDITYYQKTEQHPQILGGNFYPENSRNQLKPPEEVEFLSSHNAPDFTNCADSWTVSSSMYGQITMEAYRSGDGQFTYIMGRDEQNRTWVAAIENNAPINSTGVRETWVDGGALTTPLYEYKEQSHGYGDPQDIKGSYTSMWENYLSKNPVIQRYLRTRGLQVKV